jgi:hypothetical protein
MRFLVTNMYGNLNTVIFTPMRHMPQNAMNTLGQVSDQVWRFGERMLSGDEEDGDEAREGPGDDDATEREDDEA